MKTPCDGVGGFPAWHEDVMDRIQKVRMVRGVAAKERLEIETPLAPITEEPPLV